MDLERFPRSDSAKRMLTYVTKGWYDNSYVGKWLYEVMGIGLDQVQELIDELRTRHLSRQPHGGSHTMRSNGDFRSGRACRMRSGAG